MTTTATPPRFAEAVLRLLLPQRDRESVSGDLLEEYRETIHPSRGGPAADRWFLMQVAGIVLRRHWLFALLLGAAFVARTAYDWLLPTGDFAVRSSLTTVASLGILACAGFLATWRSGSPVSGTLAGVATALFAAVLSIGAAAVLLLLRHDPATMTAIAGSGGLGEVFTLPLMIIVPAAVIGSLGGLCAKGARSLTR